MTKILFAIALVSTSCFAQKQPSMEDSIFELVNYVRQEPKRFLTEVAQPYIKSNELENSSYSKSLTRTLQKQNPLPPLSRNKQLMDMAANFAVEAGRKGWTDHVRTDARFKKYAPEIEITGENLQFGSADALSVIMELLIDEGVRNLGHRKNILDPEFSLIGIGFGNHKTFDTIGVIVFGGFE